MSLLKMERTAEKKVTVTAKTETCVICGKDTDVPIDLDISQRKAYIVGAGQLCDDCYRKLYVHDRVIASATESYFYNQIQKYKDIIQYKEKYGYEAFKRVLDIVFCLVAMLPSLVLIGIFSIAIMIESPGNPIFSQVRVGKNGKFIKIHKLRSMRLNAESMGQKWADKDDPRVTKIGKFIRKYRIDELPQLLDVFIGEMSLIGPRPEVPILTKRFNQENPGFVTRLMVTPGLSGWAQVHGGYELLPSEKWKRDKEYIEQRSLKMYFQIFYLTIKTVFTGDGAR